MSAGIITQVGMFQRQSRWPTTYLRLIAHDGNNMPRGLFRDVGGTDPATADGDLIACWKDITNGRAYIQSDVNFRPRLSFVNGSPKVEFGPGRSWLQNTDGFSGLSSCVLVASFEPYNDENYNIFTSHNSDTWWRYEPDQSGYFGIFTDVRQQDFPPTMPLAGHTIVSLEAQSNTQAAFVNKSAVGVRNTSFYAPPAGQISLIGTDSLGGKDFKGVISAIVISENTNDREALESLVPT